MMKRISHRPLIVSFLCLLMLFACVPIASAANNTVVPVNWNRFTQGIPTSTPAVRGQDILLNANKYALTTWWNTAQNYDSQSGSTYLSFGGTGEAQIRPPASEAIALAISIATGVYDASVTGVSLTDAKNKALKLVRSVAYRHKSNLSGGWGDAWQSASWAFDAGFAGWLLWNDLSTTDQNYVRNMVEYEANRFNNYVVPYYRDKNNQIISPGDTKGEENAWNSKILQLATAMMPNHANWNVWMNKNIELMISSFARNSDLSNTTVLHGKAVKDWLNGSNLNQNGTITNHNIIHPDYMTAVTSTLNAANVYTLANMDVPKAAFFNADVVYDALVDLVLTSPPYDAPGGTMYLDDTDEVYYPQGSDWGTQRRINFYNFDVFAHATGIDTAASRQGGYWGALHGQKVLDMQNRNADGKTYINNTEDSFNEKEELVAQRASYAYLMQWLAYNGGLNPTTNVAYAANSLDAQWTMNENSGTTAADSSGNGHTGTLVGGATWVTGVAGSALHFNGTDAYVSTSYAGIGGSNPRTTVFDMKTDSGVDLRSGLVAWGDDSTNGGKWHIKLNNISTDGPVGAVRVEIQGASVIGTTNVSDGSWHQIAVVLSGSTLSNVKIYVDGALETLSQTSTASVNTATGSGAMPVWIGARQQLSANYYFKGSIDQVRMYTSALTQQEIAALD